MLARKVHGRAGSHPSVGDTLAAAIAAPHRAHPRWSFKLHHDNLLALAKMQPQLGKVPSVAVLRRFRASRAVKQRTRSEAWLPANSQNVAICELATQAVQPQKGCSDDYPLAEAMTPEPLRVTPDTPVATVARRMADHRSGSALVVDEAGVLVGVFTTTDALEALATVGDN